MNILLDELQELLQIRNENERVEFKEAKVDFSIEKLAKYCAALSNEGGGKLILGVTDKKTTPGYRYSSLYRLEWM